jgi:hypothetical protein
LAAKYDTVSDLELPVRSLYLLAAPSTPEEALGAALEQPFRHARSTGMELPNDLQIKLRIGYALSDRLAPIACAIVENLKRSTKLIEELPSAAIEAMLDHSKEQHRLDRPRTAVERAYKDVRQALITYGEVALREARERERRLLDGMTGRHNRLE